MIELRCSHPEEVPELQELFQLCFGDGPEYSGFYFDHFYRPEEFIVLREEGVLCAMAGLWSVTLTEPDGRTVKAAYLYAVGTHPEYRNKGFAAQLLHYADFYLRGKRDCLITVPAHDGLYPFYEKFGFSHCFPVLEGEAAPRTPRAGEKVRLVDGTEYDTLRESLLAGRYHVSYGEFTLLQERLCRWSGGALMAFDVDGIPGCAVVERCGETAVCKELLIAPEGLEGALALTAQVSGVRQFRLRCPAFCPGEGLSRRDFGMIKWYDPIAAKRWEGAEDSFLGLAFD